MENHEKIERVDLVVIGAGFSGLAAAKTYLELHPNEEVVVFDNGDTIGGVWAKHRLYPSIKSNNLVGTLEYPDFEMDEATYGVAAGHHIPGETLYRYLNDYAKRFGIYQRTRLSTKVESVQQADDGEGWLLHVTSPLATTSAVHTRKLIIATGINSAPFMPSLPGADSFNAPLFHVKELRARASLLSTAHDVVVLGGTKSAWDAAYAFATQSTASPAPTVHMVIRESGRGPVWMAPPYVTPLKKWLEKLVTTRLLTWFSPCVWGDADGYGWVRRLLHGTWGGRIIVDAFWRVLADDVVTLNQYDKHPETKKLKPWTNPMFLGTGLSILNYETDFFDLVRAGRIKVHIANIDALTDHAVHLSNGETLTADTVVCSTGWNPSPPLTFLPANSSALYGLPHQTSPPLNESTRRADAEILQRFPRLASQPPRHPKPNAKPAPSNAMLAETAQDQPYILYRFMVPPAFLSKNSLAFTGVAQTLLTATVASVQALWISAYFDGAIPISADAGEVEYESLLHARFGKWRYPVGHGARLPDFVFDTVPYLDLLLKQLGVKGTRKARMGGGFKGWLGFRWLQEILIPYGPSDYKNLVAEWLDTQNSRTVNNTKTHGDLNGVSKLRKEE